MISLETLRFSHHTLFVHSQQHFKPFQFLYQNPDASPDPGRLEIPFVQEAVDGPRRDRKIVGHLVHPEVALQGR